MPKAKAAKEPKSINSLAALLKAYDKGKLDRKRDQLVIDEQARIVYLSCECRPDADHDDGPHYELYTGDMTEALEEALKLLAVPVVKEK